MPTLRTETVRIDGVTFVELLLEADRSYQVRIEFPLEASVWPPREAGKPEPGWDESGVTKQVDAGVTPLGFATAAPPTDVAAEIVASEPLDETPPDCIMAWLRRVERRVETAEQLASATDLTAATEAIESIGGLGAVESLAAAIERDRRLLSRFSFVPSDLRERIEAVEIPTATFARLTQSRSA